MMKCWGCYRANTLLLCVSVVNVVLCGWMGSGSVQDGSVRRFRFGSAAFLEEDEQAAGQT